MPRTEGGAASGECVAEQAERVPHTIGREVGRAQVGRGNWLHVGGDGGLKTASVLLHVCASATRNRLDPWSYPREVLDRLVVRPTKTDLAGLLPDPVARSRLAA